MAFLRSNPLFAVSQAAVFLLSPPNATGNQQRQVRERERKRESARDKYYYVLCNALNLALYLFDRCGGGGEGRGGSRRL
jgi:hypothetical protein